MAFRVGLLAVACVIICAAGQADVLRTSVIDSDGDVRTEQQNVDVSPLAKRATHTSNETSSSSRIGDLEDMIERVTGHPLDSTMMLVCCFVGCLGLAVCYVSLKCVVVPRLTKPARSSESQQFFDDEALPAGTPPATSGDVSLPMAFLSSDAAAMWHSAALPYEFQPPAPLSPGLSPTTGGFSPLSDGASSVSDDPFGGQVSPLGSASSESPPSPDTDTPAFDDDELFGLLNAYGQPLSDAGLPDWTPDAFKLEPAAEGHFAAVAALPNPFACLGDEMQLLSHDPACPEFQWAWALPSGYVLLTTSLTPAEAFGVRVSLGLTGRFFPPSTNQKKRKIVMGAETEKGYVGMEWNTDAGWRHVGVRLVAACRSSAYGREHLPDAWVAFKDGGGSAATSDGGPGRPSVAPTDNHYFEHKAVPGLSTPKRPDPLPRTHLPYIDLKKRIGDDCAGSYVASSLSSAFLEYRLRVDFERLHLDPTATGRAAVLSPPFIVRSNLRKGAKIDNAVQQPRDSASSARSKRPHGALSGSVRAPEHQQKAAPSFLATEWSVWPAGLPSPQQPSPAAASPVAAPLLLDVAAAVPASSLLPPVPVASPVPLSPPAVPSPPNACTGFRKARFCANCSHEFGDGDNFCELCAAPRRVIKLHEPGAACIARCDR